MKKALAFLMAAVMLMSMLTACGNKDVADDTKDNNGGDVAEPALADGTYTIEVGFEGGSTFDIPVRVLDTPLTVIGDTTAMSTPHEIEYTLTFDSTTAVEAAQ